MPGKGKDEKNSWENQSPDELHPNVHQGLLTG